MALKSTRTEAFNISEYNQPFSLSKPCNQRGKMVIVTEFYLVSCNGIVFIDYRHNAVLM